MAIGIAGGRLTDGPFGLVATVVALLVVLAAVWWVRGGRGWHVDAETLVEAPPEAVFAILDDPARGPDIDPRIVRVEVRGEGRQRQHMRIRRADVELDVVEVERDPPTRHVQDVVGVRVKGKPVEAGTQRQTFTIEPAPRGSRVRLEIRGKAGSAAYRLAIGVVHPGEVRAARASLRRLRAYATAPAREP